MRECKLRQSAVPVGLDAERLLVQTRRAESCPCCIHEVALAGLQGKALAKAWAGSPLDLGRWWGRAAAHKGLSGA